VDQVSDWHDGLPKVRIELAPEPYMTRVWVNGEEWQASVKAISIDIDKAQTVVTMKFYAMVTAEGPLSLSPWPIEVENLLPPVPLS